MIYFNTLERLGRLNDGIATFREWADESPNDVFRQVVAYRCLEEDLSDDANE
ncbi:MAG: hypothetical protein P1U82_26095 [Verrucomicrobiales bacterium]|jgi:hypothetical protein|nr:hypothetical protein [bacterium]MDB2327031.1 hypothetical protein [bacterium]MDB4589628.1 hypothetical protein [Verrucomicrobiales bacterium]MDF1789360.1 hypothetical protein [Verrucomicrobiales bacterium]